MKPLLASKFTEQAVNYRVLQNWHSKQSNLCPMKNMRNGKAQEKKP